MQRRLRGAGGGCGTWIVWRRGAAQLGRPSSLTVEVGCERDFDVCVG